MTAAAPLDEFEKPSRENEKQPTGNRAHAFAFACGPGQDRVEVSHA